MDVIGNNSNRVNSYSKINIQSLNKTDHDNFLDNLVDKDLNNEISTDLHKEKFKRKAYI